MKGLLNKFLNYIKVFNKFVWKYKFVIVPAILGAIAFCLIYGTSILNPTYVDWILCKSGDPSQHYLGWEFFRKSPWTFPIGINNIISYPYPVSIIFTDSIPWMAVIFKVFSNILPEQFQYFGIYGLLIFILQGVTSGIVLKKIIKNDLFVIISSLFFILSYIVFYRMYYHTALASHYLVLWGIALVLYKNDLSLKKNNILWALLGIMSASTHIYFLIFGGISLIGYTIYELLTTRNIKKIIYSIIYFGMSSIFVIFILGGFSMPVSFFDGSFIGCFGFNLLTFFVPDYDYYSSILNYTHESWYVHEGFSYLGCGVFLMLIIAVLLIIINFIYKIIKKKKFHFNFKLFISLLVMGLISLFFACLMKVYIGNEFIHEFKLPWSIARLFGSFRSNGRFIWTLYYLIILGGIVIINKITFKRLNFILILLVLFVQLYDMQYIFKREIIPADKNIIEEELIDLDKWENVFQNDFKHIIYTSKHMGHVTKLQLDLLAIKYGKTINYYYLAQDILDSMTDIYLDYITVNLCDDCIYIIDNSSYFKYKQLPLNFYKIDDIYIATSYEYDLLEKVDNKVSTIIIEESTVIELNKRKKYDVLITNFEDDIETGDVIIDFENLEIIDNKIVLNINYKEELYVELKDDKKIKIQMIEVE